MDEVAGRRTVSFAGEGSGEGELSWGQLDVWLKMRRLGRTFAMGGARPLPPRTTVEDVAGELAYLMGRYQSMRTRFVPTTGDDPPRQVVHDHGTIDLELIPAGQDAEDVARRYRTTPFDYAAEWPVRMGAVVDGDRCTHVVLVMSHLVFDGAGAVVMMAETAARTTAPVRGIAPLEQARQQAQPAAQRHNAAALRHWETRLRQIPVPVVPPSRDVRSPRYHHGVFRSTALPAALSAAAREHGTDTAAVLLAVFAMAFAEVTGVLVLPLRLMASNRFRAELDGSVCPVSQNGLCVLDTTGAFGDVVRRARGAAMAAYKHAYYDRRALEARVAAVVADRGPGVDLDVNFNDRRFGGSLRPIPLPAGADSEFTWVSAHDDPQSGFFLSVDGSDEVLEMTLYVDSHFLAPDDAAAVLHAMETVATRGPVTHAL
ncbi:condensation domain-containing protein [Dactylosporangium sp. NBC_01737]|uniref:condensation domain-containing protein n=1 Tax=Dactylosporangium sp. NBC_01737 TaxID=2975959 RepID=UPI002E0DDA95|nr:condensation domain-containing protein [Dactylosporangium sp. NBC_01737]